MGEAIDNHSDGAIPGIKRVCGHRLFPSFPECTLPEGHADPWHRHQKSAILFRCLFCGREFKTVEESNACEAKH